MRYDPHIIDGGFVKRSKFQTFKECLPDSGMSKFQLPPVYEIPNPQSRTARRRNIGQRQEVSLHLRQKRIKLSETYVQEYVPRQLTDFELFLPADFFSLSASPPDISYSDFLKTSNPFDTFLSALPEHEESKLFSEFNNCINEFSEDTKARKEFLQVLVNFILNRNLGFTSVSLDVGLENHIIQPFNAMASNDIVEPIFVDHMINALYSKCVKTRSVLSPYQLSSLLPFFCKLDILSLTKDGEISCSNPLFYGKVVIPELFISALDVEGTPLQLEGFCFAVLDLFAESIELKEENEAQVIKDLISGKQNQPEFKDSFDGTKEKLLQYLHIRADVPDENKVQLENLKQMFLAKQEEFQQKKVVGKRSGIAYEDPRFKELVEKREDYYKSSKDRRDKWKDLKRVQNVVELLS